MEAFWIWFNSIPKGLCEYLAHMFRVCTTDDTSKMTSLPGDALKEFKAWTVAVDFPLRVAARMFYIRSIFDMVICHHGEISRQEGSLLQNIVNLSDKQWESVEKSWGKLRTEELSDSYIHSWASWMIKLQMEKA